MRLRVYSIEQIHKKDEKLSDISGLGDGLSDPICDSYPVWIKYVFDLADVFDQSGVGDLDGVFSVNSANRN